MSGTIVKLAVLAIATAALLVTQTKLAAFAFFVVLIGLFLQAVFSSTAPGRGPSV
jgi:hypothetical protein